MVLAAAPGFLCQIALHQQAIDIIISVPSAVLVDRSGTFAQSQRRYAIVLGNDDISALAQIDQSHINGVRASADYLDDAVIRSQHMVGIAE